MSEEDEGFRVVCPMCGGDGGWDQVPSMTIWIECTYCDGCGTIPTEPAGEGMETPDAE
jgi:DnaJ-class molecular chaperone